MRRRLIYLAALALVLIVVMAPSATAQEEAMTTVSIQDFFFSPANVSVEPGTTL